MTPAPRNINLARALAVLVPAALLGGAYVSQYGFGLYPCEMCWWQRYAHFAALVPALLALAVSGTLRVWFVRLAGAGIAVGALLGAYHAGVEYGWWEGITTCASTAQAGGNPLDAILDAPLVRCDAVAWSLFGISLAGWNFLISGVTAVAIFAFTAPKRDAGVKTA